MVPKDKDTGHPEQDDKGFAVHDKRRIGREDESEAAAAPADVKTEETAAGGPEADPGVAFAPEDVPARESTDRTPQEEPPGPESGAPGGERSYVSLTFTSFIMSLSTSALIYLGQVPDPVTGKTAADIVGARQTIDLISLLKEKTKGNLTPEEESFIEAVLYDLRMLFVKANG
jgi:hypothetical protein